MVNEAIAFLRLNVDTAETLENNRKLVLGVSMVLAVYAAIMSVINLLDGSMAMFLSTFSLTIVFIVSAVVCLIHYNRRLVAILLGFALVVLFSMYAINGSNDGFAMDWILLVPVAYMTLFGLGGGLIIGGYFWVFLFVCLWTPVRELLPYSYGHEVVLRFPILYSCGFFLAIVIGIRGKKLQQAQCESEAHLSRAVLKERNRVETLSLEAISSVCRALDAKDNYTKEHSDHVASYSCHIARSLGWGELRIEQLNRAARVHDLGKIGVPDRILNKDGPLTDEEFAIMRTHVSVGAEIAADFTTMPELEVGAKYHHERYDGKGYMQGLSGEDIPIEARIIALADSIDAMSSDRVYRNRRTRKFLLDELRSGSGKQFDPTLVEVAVALIDDDMLEEVAMLTAQS